jgi:hypothetical protein
MEAFPNALTEVNKMLQTNPSIIAYSTAGSKFVIKACCVMTSGGVNGT